MKRGIIGLAALGFLAACTGEPPQPQPLVVKQHKAVPDVSRTFVPLDSSLLEDCPIAEPKTMHVSEAVRVPNARKIALEVCNRDKAAIRASNPMHAVLVSH